MRVLGAADELPAEPPTVVFLSLPDGVGGSTRSLANLLGYLDGEATRVLAAPPAGRFVGLVADGAKAEWHLPVVDWGERRAVLRRARTALRLVRALRPHRHRVHAIHANGFNELAAALPAALLWRLPVVVWVHNSTAGRAVGMMRRLWGPVRRRVEIRWAAVSPLARDVVAEAGLARATDVVIVGNPIDADDLVAGPREPATDRPAGAPVTVAYLGAPRDNKGFHLVPDLVEAVGERAPVSWLIFSRPTDDHLPDVWDRLRRLEAAGRLSVEGKLTDVSKAYARCDVVVCPSLRESFCRVAAEAMLNGIPVVASDLEPVRDLLGDGDAGLVFPVGDVEAAAGAIVRLARDPQLRDRLGAEGRERAGAFGPAPVREGFLDLLELRRSRERPTRLRSGPMGGTPGGAARRYARALAFPVIQLARERRSPLRQRYAISRRGLGLQAVRRHRLPHAGSPIRLARGLVGATDRQGPIWAVTLVRNEERRVEAAVRCLVAGGVDLVVVADNLSTDGTRDLLADLARELPVVVVSDREPAYYQGPKMSLMARNAARHGASWIVPFDADELWLGVDGTLAERLRALDGDAAIAPLFDFPPRPDQASISNPVEELTHRRVASHAHKIAFRAHLLGTLSTGNHWVMQPVRRTEGALTIRHYPFLGYEHFVEKARSGAAALDRTDLPRNVGEHWRDWADDTEADLVERWRQICSQELVEDLLPDGALGSPATR